VLDNSAAPHTHASPIPEMDSPRRPKDQAPEAGTAPAINPNGATPVRRKEATP
jgi:hypothetical protein